MGHGARGSVSWEWGDLPLTAQLLLDRCLALVDVFYLSIGHILQGVVGAKQRIGHLLFSLGVFRGSEF
eukprot:scaffold30328_cov94-Isochrysis_galbana.AAC.2